MGFTITKATKKNSRLRLALIGPSGSGKTYSALAVATTLGARVVVIDTERGSASKYADRFAFDVLELDTFAPQTYCDAIAHCEEAGYDVIVVDSLSHAWMGKDGALEMVDKAAAKSNSRNSFDAWRSVTPHHNHLVDAMLRCRAHLVVTMRSKTEYVLEEDARGKKVPRKVGMAPVQRDGLEYEFDVVGEMNADHGLVVTKSRCSALADAVVEKPGAAFGKALLTWLTDAPPVVMLTADEVTAEHDAIAHCDTREGLDTIAQHLSGFKARVRPEQYSELRVAWAARREVLVKPTPPEGSPAAPPLTSLGIEASNAKAARDNSAAKEDADALRHGASIGDIMRDGDEMDRADDAADRERAAIADDVAQPAPVEAPPVLVSFYQRVAAIELPGESVAVWVKHRAELATMPAPDREAAWKALCLRTEECGRLKNGKVWLKKALAEHDARGESSPSDHQAA